MGLLLDPVSRRVYKYIPGLAVEEFDNPDAVSVGDLMPGFVLDLNEIW